MDYPWWSKNISSPAVCRNLVGQVVGEILLMKGKSIDDLVLGV